MSKMNIKPLADRVLIEPAAAETKTVSPSLIFPTSKIPKYAVIPGMPRVPINTGKSILPGLILKKPFPLFIEYC